MGFNDQQNKRISNFIVDELRLNPVSDNIPKTVVPSIQPTFEVDRKFSVPLATNNNTATGSATILTTPANVDTYITGVHLSFIKDATCDVATNSLVQITAISQGTTYGLLSFPLITLTAQTGSDFAVFNPPLKVDRGTAIALTSATFSAGIMLRFSKIFGYTEQTGDVTP